MELETLPLSKLSGTTAANLEQLDQIGIHTLCDLLLHLPAQWQDRTQITPISQLEPEQAAQIEGQVVHVTQPRGRRMLLVRIADASGQLDLMFFNYYYNLIKKLPGARLRCFGKPKARSGQQRLHMTHPSFEFISDNRPSAALPDTLTPVYPPITNAALQKHIKKLISECLKQAHTSNALADPVSKYLPRELRQYSLLQALEQVHRPPPDSHPAQSEAYQQAKDRIALDELVADMLNQMQSATGVRQFKAPSILETDTPSSLEQQLLASLPFEPTGAQLRVNREIAQDLSRSQPMLRLLQGDVGSGKTLVALCAAVRTIAAGWQVAIVAPTEILVEQHLLNMSQWVSALHIDLATLCSSTPEPEKRTICNALESGQLTMIIGTHALFEERVQFHKLGLVIVDEQHRFGVQQRLKLIERSSSQLQPHQLTMTATPIPRTLAMTRYADMDVSVLDEMPPGRHAVQTSMHSERSRERIIKRIGERCQQQDRAYWVCPLIEESEAVAGRAALPVFEELQHKLPELSIGLIHGRMKSAEKLAAIAGFKSGQYQLLVSTSVIEVGMDIAEATFMVIENPERFGLAQLHQLRGRIGRSSRVSHCVLIHNHDISQGAMARIKTLCQHQNGFDIAEADLMQRGPGELLGVRQAGEAEFQVFDYRSQQHLLDPAKAIAQQLLAAQLQADPSDGLHQQLARLQSRWRPTGIAYARV
ncbi:MAG: ATP-dependent DNA helicase RecG [Gammaproteobacteria bacterium]